MACITFSTCHSKFEWDAEVCTILTPTVTCCYCHYHGHAGRVHATAWHPDLKVGRRVTLVKFCMIEKPSSSPDERQAYRHSMSYVSCGSSGLQSASFAVRCLRQQALHTSSKATVCGVPSFPSQSGRLAKPQRPRRCKGQV